MSYLNSILASAGVSPIPVAPQPARKPAVRRPSGLSSNDVQEKSMGVAPTAVKRKASDNLPTSTVNTKRPATIAKSTESSNGIPRPLEARNSVSTARPDVPGVKKTVQRPAGAKPPPKPPTASTKSTGAPAKPGSSIIPTAPAQGGKLSFAEIIARGKALSSTNLGKTTGFVNKATTAKSKEQVKDPKQSKGAERSKGAIGKSRAKATSRSGSEELSVNKKAAKNEKPKKKPVEVAYKGTMRPVVPPPSYRGTAKPNSVPRYTERDDRRAYGNAPAGRDRHRQRSPSYGYEDEEEEMYDSEGSSDMEAGAWDIDEEEDLALKAARKEDAEALREEEEHKRKKAARKAELARLSAASKRRY